MPDKAANFATEADFVDAVDDEDEDDDDEEEEEDGARNALTLANMACMSFFLIIFTTSSTFGGRTCATAKTKYD